MIKRGLHRLRRFCLALLGCVLIAAGVPIAILTPVPFLPIGLPVILIGLALLVRNFTGAALWIEKQIGLRSRFARKLPRPITRILNLAPSEAPKND